ncbi:MAG: 6-phosphogluconolactonase [Pseudomonadota bacterium]
MVELTENPKSEAHWISFPDRQSASAAAASLAASSLSAAVAERGTAVFLSSGGSTPADMLEMLSHQMLPWSDVTIGLVDDRFVQPDHPASNEGLLRRHLFQGSAVSAAFEPLWTPDRPIEYAAKDAASRYAPLVPSDFVLLGMGSDGHTASWFPGAKNLKDAIDVSADRVVAIDASGCRVAGDHALRLTLSAPAIAATKHAVLLIFGDEKKAVFESAMNLSVEKAPVRAAVESLKSKLIIAWAP